VLSSICVYFIPTTKKTIFSIFETQKPSNDLEWYFTSIIAINIGIVVAIAVQGFNDKMKELRHNYLMRKILFSSGGLSIIYGFLMIVATIFAKGFDNRCCLAILLSFQFYLLWKTLLYIMTQTSESDFKLILDNWHIVETELKAISVEKDVLKMQNNFKTKIENSLSEKFINIEYGIDILLKIIDWHISSIKDIKKDNFKHIHKQHLIKNFCKKSGYNLFDLIQIYYNKAVEQKMEYVYFGWIAEQNDFFSKSSGKDSWYEQLGFIFSWYKKEIIEYNIRFIVEGIKCLDLDNSKIIQENSSNSTNAIIENKYLFRKILGMVTLGYIKKNNNIANCGIECLINILCVNDMLSDENILRILENNHYYILSLEYMTSNIYDLLDDNVKESVDKNIDLLNSIIKQSYIHNAGKNENKINQYQLNIKSLTKLKELIKKPMKSAS
jgi:hypothetical protein